MLPPGEGAEAIFTEVPVIGSTVSRESHEEGLQEAETTCANTTVEAATFSTLFPNGVDGFGNTPTGCTHRRYIHKMRSQHLSTSFTLSTMLSATR